MNKAQSSWHGFHRVFVVSALTLALAACSGSSGSKAPSSVAPGSSSVATSSSQSSQAAGEIKLNQVGYPINAQKLAVIPATAANYFSVVVAGTDEEIYSGSLGAAATWVPAQESVKLANFSALTTPGEYQVRVTGLPDSPAFRISGDIYQALNEAGLKAFYFNRASTELLPEHAGVYARPAGHPDDKVFIHASAADATRPEGTVISGPKGWYDAGDYNKYIVNSGISTYTLLAAYEHFPEHYRAQHVNIPESDNAVPDLLDEAWWNLTWMLTMQDPNDGGVYHKLTTKNFEGAVMPHEAKSPRYVVQKGTGAALNFAAVMAAASRIYADYEAHYPGLSASMLEAAEAAWAWAQANPNVRYEQPADIRTGAYGDNNFTDEFAWAAAELYITTNDDRYYAAINLPEAAIDVPSWGNVSGLPWISLAHHLDGLTNAADKNLIKQRVNEMATTLYQQTNDSAYAVAMQTGDFIWGSNSVALGQAMMLLQAYRLDHEPRYLDAAQSLLDYTLGRNPTDFSYVTGFGTKTPQHIHHRPSEADGIAAPIPGFIAGGAQPGQQDAKDCPVAYPSSAPAKAYLDHWCSYASNEVTINWNAPLVYVSGALQVLTENVER
jgi:endoglucanase